MASNNKKRLTRSTSNKTISGVLGGVGEYFDVDPVLVRAAFVVASAFSGFVPGILAYIGLLLIVPENKPASK